MGRDTLMNKIRPVCPPAALTALSTLAALLLSACAVSAPPASVPLQTPTQWYAPLPPAADGAAAPSALPTAHTLAGLSAWWQQQGDAVLLELIEAGQAASPSVSTALSNLRQAQATRAGSSAALLPTADLVGNASRSRSAPINRTPALPVNAAQIGLQTSWEIDLFGQLAATVDADAQRIAGTQALWHDARISVAAEVARQYYTLRSCQKLLLVSVADARSRGETERLSALATRAGFEAPATSALARASAAESNARATQQRAQCDVDVKTLVALTGLAEPALRQKLSAGEPLSPAPDTGSQQQQALQGVSAIPADVLAQRPDVFNAARQLAALSFETVSNRAERYPRLSLAGSITTGRTRARNFKQSYDTWSIGPLALTVPLFDGGASEARLAATIARYEEAADTYRSVARQAVREVEEALVNLQSTGDRTGDAALAADGYNASFTGTEARYKAGLASLVELEDSRRTLLAAQTARVNLELERRSAWIALYRALGGGWSADTTEPAPEPAPLHLTHASHPPPPQPQPQPRQAQRALAATASAAPTPAH